MRRVPDSDELVVPLGQAVLLVQAGLALGGIANNDLQLIAPVVEVPRLAAPSVFPGEMGSLAGTADVPLEPVAAEAEPIDAKPSPCGRFVGFVLDDELCICRSDGTGPVVQVTAGARGVDGLSNATADYCSAEDLDRYTAWWWGPDSTKLLVQHTDERRVPLLRIARLGDDEEGFDAVETHRYPLPGGPTPLIRMAVISIGDVLTQLDLPDLETGAGPATATDKPRSALHAAATTPFKAPPSPLAATAAAPSASQASPAALVWPPPSRACPASPASFSPASARRAGAVPPRPLLVLHSASRSLPICLGSPGPSPDRLDGTAADFADVLVPDAGFCPDGSVYVQVLSRDFTQLDLVRFCTTTGRAELLVREANPAAWVNPDHLLTWLPLDDPQPLAPSPSQAADASWPSGVSSPQAGALAAGKGFASPEAATPGGSQGIRRSSSGRRVDAADAATAKPSPSGAALDVARATATARVRQQMLFVWASERSGYRHLLLYAVGLQFSFEADLTIAKARAAADGTDPTTIGEPDARGIPTGPGDPRRVVLVPGAEPEATLRRPLTGGDWLVANSSEGTGNGCGLAVHAASKSILFTANAAAPLEMHVYRAPLLTQRASIASAGSPRGFLATSPHHSSLVTSSLPPTPMAGCAAGFVPPSGLPAGTAPSRAASRSLRPRVSHLLGAGSVGEDLASWGLTLGTYNISQVTPGYRGRCGMIVSPDGAFAVMTRASLAENHGAPSSDLVRLDTLAESSGHLAGTGGAPSTSASRSGVSLDGGGRYAGLFLDTCSRAPGSRDRDITGAVTPGTDLGGVEVMDAPAAFRASRVARREASSAGGANSLGFPSTPTVAFRCPAPSTAFTLHFPRDEPIVSPSGFRVTRLCRLSGPDLGPVSLPPAAATSMAAAVPAPAFAPQSLFPPPNKTGTLQPGSPDAESAGAGVASEPMRIDLSLALGIDPDAGDFAAGGARRSDSTSSRSSIVREVRGSASPQSFAGTLDTLGVSQTAQEIIAANTAPVVAALSPRAASTDDRSLGAIAAAAAGASREEGGSGVEAGPVAASPPPPIGPSDGVVFFACPAADGITTLFGVIQLPQPAAGSSSSSSSSMGGPPPAVLRVYGGPHVQMVRDDERALGGGAVQALRKQGMAVFSVDNRGSWDRGRRFESAIGGRMGLTDVADQFAATRFLIDKGFVDPRRLGATGWSYGGFMTLMLLAKSAAVEPASLAARADSDSVPARPKLVRSESGSGFVSKPPVCFRVGVAGGSVTDWRMYESSYTEHYMGFPAENADAYDRGSVLNFVDGLRGKHVMLIHGLLDENVLVRHTTRLMSRMVKADIPFESLLLPDCRHGPRTAGEGRAVMKRSLEHFKRHLM